MFARLSKLLQTQTHCVWIIEMFDYLQAIFFLLPISHLFVRNHFLLGNNTFVEISTFLFSERRDKATIFCFGKKNRQEKLLEVTRRDMRALGFVA